MQGSLPQVRVIRLNSFDRVNAVPEKDALICIKLARNFLIRILSFRKVAFIAYLSLTENFFLDNNLVRGGLAHVLIVLIGIHIYCPVIASWSIRNNFSRLLSKNIQFLFPVDIHRG